MTPDAVLQLAIDRAPVSPEHQLLAPALLRSQLVSLLFEAVGRGELTKRDAMRHLDYARGLPLRLLGDRVLQRRSFDVAEALGWPDTYTAEYVALTQLHADALVTADARLVAAVEGVVATVPVSALL